MKLVNGDKLSELPNSDVLNQNKVAYKYNGISLWFNHIKGASTRLTSGFNEYFHQKGRILQHNMNIFIYNETPVTRKITCADVIL